MKIIFSITSIFIFLPIFVLAHGGEEDEHMMDGFGHMMNNLGFGGMGLWFGWFVMVLFWVFLIVAVVALIKWISGISSQGQRQSQYDSAIELLKRRYAKGEINKEEFERKIKDLEKV